MRIYLEKDLAPPDDPNPFLINMMRANRDQLLMNSDWTQMADSPLTTQKKTEWATYRQQLRDFPASWTPSEYAEFPDPPS